MENKGIIISGGQFKAKNVIVGDNAKMSVNPHTAKSAKTEDVSKNKVLSDKIKDSIKEGKIEEAGDVLMAHFKENGNKEALNAMIMHVLALNALQMKENLDTITHEQAKIDRARVINAVLYLVDNQL